MAAPSKSTLRSALCFSSTRLDLARARRAGERFELSQLDSFEVNADGRLAAVKRLAKQLGRCQQVLMPGEYNLLQMDSPDMQGDELKAALRWKIKEMVDYPVEQATLDVMGITLEGAAAARGKQCYVVVAKNAVLTPKIQLFQDAKVLLEVIDIPEMAQRNVAALFEVENRGLALLNFTAEGGLLTFTYRGELYSSRRIEISLEQLEQADEARRTDLFDRIALEVQRSVDNFERMYNFITLSRLMTADLPTVPGLFDYLKGYLSVKTEPMDLAEVIDFPTIPELRNVRRQSECLPVIGTALRMEA